MSELRNKKLIVLLAALGVSIVILFFGCSENQSISTTAPDNYSEKPSIDSGTVVHIPETTLVAADTANFLGGLLGGSLTMILAGEKVEFEIKVAALTKLETIFVIGSRYKITEYDPFGNVRKYEFFVYEFGPVGLEFLIPMELTQDIRRDDGSIAHMYYYDNSVLDGDGKGWEVNEVVAVADGRGTFHIGHFSKYGISYLQEDPENETYIEDDPQK